MRRQEWYAVVIVGLVLSAGFGPGSAPAETTESIARCSLRAIPTAQDPRATVFVGTAAGDTVRAGSGGLEITAGPGHWGDGGAREVFGQVVHVGSLDGAGAEVVRNAIERQASNEVVVVPWDYTASCQPTYWSRSARWIEPGLVSLYVVRLRPETEWVEGRPTFDAPTADISAYPHGAYFERGYRDTRALHERPSLNADEMFDLYTLLPPSGVSRGEGREFLDRLSHWEASNPDLATRYPADVVLADVRRRLGGP